MGGVSTNWRENRAWSGLDLRVPRGHHRRRRPLDRRLAYLIHVPRALVEVAKGSEGGDKREHLVGLYLRMARLTPPWIFYPVRNAQRCLLERANELDAPLEAQIGDGS